MRRTGWGQADPRSPRGQQVVRSGSSPGLEAVRLSELERSCP